MSTASKLRIFAAGSFGNFIVAVVMFSLLFLSNSVIGKVIQPIGVEFESTIEGTPAYEVNLSGMIIGINNESVHSLDELSSVLERFKPGDNVTINTTEGIYKITLTTNPENEERAFIGIKNLRTVFTYTGPLAEFGRVSERDLKIIGWYVGLLMLLFGINLGVGIANLFPIKPLDGGFMMEEILKPFFKDDAKRLANYISLFTLGLLLINIFGPSVVG